MSDGHEGRRAKRVAIRIPAQLLDGDGTQIAVMVEDVSSGGFRLKTDEMLVPGERARLRIDQAQDYLVEIQWVSRGEAGGRFLEPVEIIDGIPR